VIRHLIPWRAREGGDITLLTAPGHRLTKKVTETGIDDYEGSRLFAVDARRLDGIDDVPRLLQELAPRSDTFPIRGVIKREFADRPRVLRRIHDQADPDRPGHIIVAPFEPVPRRWLMIDFEPAAVPAYIDPVDPVVVGGWLRQRLPALFRSVRCVVQLSSGAGLKPGARAHLWFWLDRALGKPELDLLLGDVPGIDRSVLGAVQPNYTASPVFEGIDDPCVDGRVALLPGYPEVEVGALPEPRVARHAFIASSVEARPYAAPSRGLHFKATRPERYLLKCVRAVAEAPPGERHPTIVCVSTRLFGLAKSGALDPADVAARIQGAVGLSSFDRDHDEVVSALRWAWEHSTPWTLP
jgi:hypothetical protein